MRHSLLVIALLTIGLAACGKNKELAGAWKAVSVDMSFAEGQIPQDQMEEAKKAFLAENAPSFDLNSDGSARIMGGTSACNGTWSVEGDLVSVSCDGTFLKLERKGSQLTTLPDRTFTLERQ